MTALQLLPWIGSTYDRAQIREWQISAERLSAGVLTGIDYPSPAHVSQLCEYILDTIAKVQDDDRHQVTCEDAADLPSAVYDLASAIAEAESKAEEEEERADKLATELDECRERAIAAEKDRDAARGVCDDLRASQEATILALRDALKVALGMKVDE